MVRQLRRQLLKNIPRSQWDGMHPGPLAGQIRATVVDYQGYRYELLEYDEAVPSDKKRVRVQAYVRTPSNDQIKNRCFLCRGTRHNPKNKECVAFGKHVKSLSTTTLYNMSTGAPLSGRWRRIGFLVPPRYKSGTAEFTVFQ